MFCISVQFIILCAQEAAKASRLNAIFIFARIEIELELCVHRSSLLAFLFCVKSLLNKFVLTLNILIMWYWLCRAHTFVCVYI